MTVILGGGISGLAAAYYAVQNPRITSITLLEATNRWGGWIKSLKLPDGTMFEQGPRTLRVVQGESDNTLNMLEELRLTNTLKPITTQSPVMINKFIYKNNKLTLYRLPIFDIIKNDLTAKRVKNEDESVYSFTSRRFGTDVADTFSAVICGIYGGDAKEISIKYFLKTLFEAEQKYGSVVFGAAIMNITKAFSRKIGNVLKKNNEVSDLIKRAKIERWLAFTIDGGLEQLPSTLTKYLDERNVKMKKEHKCEQLRFQPNGIELVVNGDVMKSSHVIATLPHKKLAELVKHEHPELAQELQAIPMVTIGTVVLQFPANVLSVTSFGYLIPPKVGIPILGVLFDSCITGNTKTTVLTVMMGGAWFEKYFGKSPSEEQLLKLATDHVKHVLSIKDDPLAVHVSILRDCITQFVVGHERRMTRIRDYISAHKLPLTLCGTSYDGVGVNNAILSAKQAVSKIV